MKFLADMGISPKTVLFLRSMDYEAVHLSEERLHRLEDSAILQKARDEEYVLLTHDLDFGELVAASGARLPSVIVFRLRNMRPENVNHHLEQIINNHGDLLESGVFVSVTEGRIRMRPLPL